MGEGAHVIEERRSELENTGYEIFIALLSVLSIVNLVLMYAIADEALDTVIDAMNILFSVIFLAQSTNVDDVLERRPGG